LIVIIFDFADAAMQNARRSSSPRIVATARNTSSAQAKFFLQDAIESARKVGFRIESERISAK
jgi:hypothetical protein